MKNWENKGSVEGNLWWKKTTQKIITIKREAERAQRQQLKRLKHFNFQPSGANEWHTGGSQAVVIPDFAISGTFISKFLHQSCLWDSQLNACMYNS